jgi:porin
MNQVRSALHWVALAVAGIFLGLAAPADAQTTGAATASSPLQPVINFGQSFGQAVGQPLANAGIYLQLGYNQDISSVVAGGVRTGTMPIGQATAGFTLDLQTILGIPEASFHFLMDERNGIPIGTDGGIAGTTGPLQGDAGPIKYRLSEFYWEQGFDHDRLDIIAGRTQPTLDFAISDVSCEFIGSMICAQPGSWYFMNADEPFGTAEWGGRVRFQITPRIYAMAGGYDEDPSQGGFEPAGFDWNVEHSVGAFIPMEVGYQTTLSSAQYPGKYNVGGYIDTSRFSQADGLPGKGRNAVYIQLQQTVWRPNKATTQSLTLFGGGIVYSGNGPFWGQYYAGFLDRAPFASRPDDTIAFIGSLYYQNSGFLHDAKHTQAIFELNYGFGIIPGLVFKPYVQYVVSPNNPLDVMDTSGSTSLPNAWVIGFQVAIDFNGLLHLPVFSPH